MSITVCDNLNPLELLHLYILERSERASTLSSKDLLTIQSWLKASNGDVNLVLLVLEERWQGLKQGPFSVARLAGSVQRSLVQRQALSAPVRKGCDSRSGVS